MIRKIVFFLVVLIAVILVCAALKPSFFHVERSITVNAAPTRVFLLVNNFRHWMLWSPYEETGSPVKRSFRGSETGAGSAYQWQGKAKGGSGEMTMIESVPNERIKIDLHVTEPFVANNQVEISFKPEGTSTKVTWSMSGNLSYVLKIFSIFFGEKVVAAQFEQGLVNLKIAVENNLM